MRFSVKHFPFFFQISLIKLRKAVGVKSTSRTLLFDCDILNNETNMEFAFEWFKHNYPKAHLIVMYRTPHGFHVIIVLDKHKTFLEQVKALLDCPFVDRYWIGLGINRKYWFLEGEIPIPLATYMEIERNA